MVEVDESQLSPGKLLLQGRLQAGLTQEQIAKELYMTLSKVKALESDDYARLSSDTFVRGYIRAYANLLKLDVVKVLAAYEHEVHNAASTSTSFDGGIHKNSKAANNNAAQKSTKAFRGTWQFLGFLGIFFVGLWLISVWFFDNHADGDRVMQVTNISSLAANVDNLPITAAPHMTSSGSSLGIPDITQIEASALAKLSVEKSAAADADALANSSSVAADKRVLPQQGTQSSSAAAVTAIAPNSSVENVNLTNIEHTKIQSGNKKADLDEISFSFRGESWLEVSDSRGDVLATELQPGGSKLKLVGKSPFDVKLGNAPAVDIQLNGRKIDVIPLLGSNVLTLKVGSSSGH